MSWATTHWALEGVVVFSIMGVSNREAFFQSERRNKFYFLLLNFVALLPDFDSLFLMHRTISHSFIIPLALFNLGMVYGYIRYTRKGEDFDLLARALYLAGLFYFFHILMDIGYGGSAALFYPLDTTMYEIETYLIILPQPWLLIFPFKIIKYDITIKALTFEQGRLSYFLNLPPSAPERQIYYALWYSPEHLLIVLIWFTIVGNALISRKGKNKETNNEKNLQGAQSIKAG